MERGMLIYLLLPCYISSFKASWKCLSVPIIDKLVVLFILLVFF